MPDVIMSSKQQGHEMNGSYLLKVFQNAFLCKEDDRVS